MTHRSSWSGITVNNTLRPSLSILAYLLSACPRSLNSFFSHEGYWSISALFKKKVLYSLFISSFSIISRYTVNSKCSIIHHPIIHVLLRDNYLGWTSILLYKFDLIFRQFVIRPLIRVSDYRTFTVYRYFRIYQDKDLFPVDVDISGLHCMQKK